MIGSRPWAIMKSQFESNLIVKKLEGKGQENNWQVAAPLIFKSFFLKRTIEIPAGFVTDFASVPRLPFAYWLTGNIAQEAATIPDFLYQTHSTSKATADRVFLEAMKATKVVAWRRWLMYTMVSLFGWTSYGSGPDRFRVLNSQ